MPSGAVSGDKTRSLDYPRPPQYENPHTYVIALPLKEADSENYAKMKSMLCMLCVCYRCEYQTALLLVSAANTRVLTGLGFIDKHTIHHLALLNSCDDVGDSSLVQRLQ